MSSTNVVSICQPFRTFSAEEINDLITILERITSKHEATVANLLKKQRYLITSGVPASEYNKIDSLVGGQLIQWGTKITKLGGKVFSHGYVGFDGGGFWYSWHLGDKSITHYHGYDESPLNRRPVLVKI